MPIREYICTTTECPENTGHLDAGTHKVIELLVGLKEEPDCEVCGAKLKQIIEQGPRGKVMWSENPVKQ